MKMSDTLSLEIHVAYNRRSGRL